MARIDRTLSLNEQQPQSVVYLIERAILLAFGILRVGVIIQMVATTVFLLLGSRMPLASAVAVGATTLWSTVYIGMAVHKKSFLNVSYAWGIVDVILGGLTIVVAGVALPTELLVGTWDAWFYAYTSVVVPTIAVWARTQIGSITLAIAVALL